MDDNDAMTRRITDADVARYRADGAICLRGLFDEAWVERMRGAIERKLTDGRKFAVERMLWPHDAAFGAFVFESAAARIAQRLMGSRTVRIYFDQFFVKEPGTEAPTPWHHDQPFWPVRGEQVCSIWLALDTVTRESSGLEYIRGSHRWQREFRPAAFTAKTQHLFDDARHGEPAPDFDAERGRHEFLSWDMAPGDCLVHQALAVHGAGGNHTPATRRRALSTRWLGDDAVYAPRPGQDDLLYDSRLQPGQPLASDKFPLIVGG